MDIVSLMVGIIGTASTLILLYERAIRRMGARRLIGFDASSSVDVVCTTGDESRSRYGSSATLRALAPEGELQALGAVSNSLGRWYPRTEMSLQMSDRSTRKLDRDLVLIGGPAGNRCSAEVLSQEPLEGLIHIDASTSSLTVCSFQANGYDHRLANGRPQRDLGLILCARNPWSRQGKRRLIILAGLTTYGTGAAADYLFDNIGKDSSPFTADVRAALRSTWPVAIVIEASFINGYLSGCRMVHWERLKKATPKKLNQ